VKEGLISIIMPVRDAMPFLVECLTSIMAQTYVNWELCVVNDHSTDDSWQLLKAWTEKDTRIKVYQNSGKGIIDALNKGYSESTGDYITRMDADDVMPVEKLEILHSILLEVGSGYVSTGKIKYIRDTELGDGFKKYEAWINELCDSQNHFTEIYKECVIPSPCWMMYRVDFDRIGGFDSPVYPEDYELCFRIYKHGMKVKSSDKVLHIWRDYDSRTSRTDPNYEDNRFLSLKTSFFLECDHDPQNKLILWGAGKKGKEIAQLLIASDTDFIWVTNNEKKIGRHIYNILVHSSEQMRSIRNSEMQIILAVANPAEQEEIKDSIHSFASNIEIYRFC